MAIRHVEDGDFFHPRNDDMHKGFGFKGSIERKHGGAACYAEGGKVEGKKTSGGKSRPEPTEKGEGPPGDYARGGPPRGAAPVDPGEPDADDMGGGPPMGGPPMGGPPDIVAGPVHPHSHQPVGETRHAFGRVIKHLHGGHTVLHNDGRVTHHLHDGSPAPMMGGLEGMHDASEFAHRAPPMGLAAGGSSDGGSDYDMAPPAYVGRDHPDIPTHSDRTSYGRYMRGGTDESEANIPPLPHPESYEGPSARDMPGGYEGPSPAFREVASSPAFREVTPPPAYRDAEAGPVYRGAPTAAAAPPPASSSGPLEIDDVPRHASAPSIFSIFGNSRSTPESRINRGRSQPSGVSPGIAAPAAAAPSGSEWTIPSWAQMNEKFERDRFGAPAATSARPSVVTEDYPGSSGGETAPAPTPARAAPETSASRDSRGDRAWRGEPPVPVRDRLWRGEPPVDATPPPSRPAAPRRVARAAPPVTFPPAPPVDYYKPGPIVVAPAAEAPLRALPPRQYEAGTRAAEGGHITGEGEGYAGGGFAGGRPRLPRGMTPRSGQRHSVIGSASPPQPPAPRTPPPQGGGGRIPYGVGPSAEPDVAGAGQGIPQMKRGGETKRHDSKSDGKKK